MTKRERTTLALRIAPLLQCHISLEQIAEKLNAQLSDVQKIIRIFDANKLIIRDIAENTYRKKRINISPTIIGNIMGYKSSYGYYCRNCHSQAYHLFSHIDDEGNAVYVDADKGAWGKDNECPDCVVGVEECGDLNIYHEKRMCPQCQGKLETSRWFACLTCKPVNDCEIMETWDVKVEECYVNSY